MDIETRLHLRSFIKPDTSPIVKAIAGALFIHALFWFNWPIEDNSTAAEIPDWINIKLTAGFEVSENKIEKTETKKIIEKSIKKKNILSEKNEVEQKQIGKGFIHYRGTFTEKEAIMIDSDRNLYDEVDKSKTSVIRDYASRLGFSKLREQIYFSTPTIPDFGIDALFQKSDQKYWRFNCPHCKYRQHMEWEKNALSKKDVSR